MEEVEKLWFPEGSVFAKNINLQKGIPYNETKYENMFKPYSPEINWDLEDYLIRHERGSADNHFEGSEYFLKMKEKGLLQPWITYLRVGQNPLPDIGFFVNKDYLLESRGSWEYNMSLMWAKKGIYEPSEILKDRTWSISGLKLWE